MSGIERDFRRSFRRLGRATFLRYLASSLVYCLVLTCWSFAANRLLDGFFGTAVSWWWIVGLGSLLILTAHFYAVRALTTEWVKKRSRGLFSHDELASALDFVKRPSPSPFMKAHLIRTGLRLEKLRLPWLHSFTTLHLVLMLSLSLVWIPQNFWVSPTTSDQSRTSEGFRGTDRAQPPRDSERRDDNSFGKPEATQRAASGDGSRDSSDEPAVGKSSTPAQSRTAERESPRKRKDDRLEQTNPGRASKQSFAARSPGDSGSERRADRPGEGLESPRTERASSGDRLERKIDRFVPAGGRMSPGQPSRSAAARRLRADLQTDSTRSGEESADSGSSEKRGASGGVGSGDGSKELGPASSIRAALYESPVEGVSGDGPREIRPADHRRGTIPSVWRNRLITPGSSFPKKQTPPPSYRGLVEKYISSTRAKRPDQSNQP